MFRNISLFLCLVFLLSACRASTPPPPVMHQEGAYEVEIHSFCTEETDVTILFHKKTALLLDCSINADRALLLSYLAAHGVSKPRYVLTAPGALPPIPADRVYPADAWQKMKFPFGDGFISASMKNGEIKVKFQYKGADFPFPLTPQATRGAAQENTFVTIIKPAADGVQSQITRKSLAEILPL